MVSRFQKNETVFREAVRRYIRDQAPLNTLLAGYETDDEGLDIAIELALSDFNTTAPVITNYTLKSFPSFIILLYGTVIQVLQSAGILQARNELDYSAGGVTVQISNKSGLYASWVDRLLSQYEVKKTNLKVQINAGQAWGGIDSEYGLIDQFQGD
jgi:hypothetical protein